MKEQVKEWIVDKNLTTDSFDSIMIGVIYNSGHSTLDDPDVRKWIETHPSEFRGMLLPNLTDDQQVVLEWLKREHFDSYIKSVLSNLYFYVNMTAIGDLENKEIQEMVNAYEKLSQEDFAQVLQVFGKWAEEQEEE